MENLLPLLAGSWAGENAFVLMPTDEPTTAPLTAEIATTGLAVVLHYTWHHAADGAQRGTLMIGRSDEPGGLTALWSDSWHQHPRAQTLTGSVDDDGAAHLECVYAEGDWRWRIAIEQARPDAIVLRMVNVVPPAAAGTAEPLAYDAMHAELRRA